MKFHIGDKVILKGSLKREIHTIIGTGIGIVIPNNVIVTDLSMKLWAATPDTDAYTDIKSYWLEEDCFEFYKDDSHKELIKKAKEIRKLGDRLLKI